MTNDAANDPVASHSDETVVEAFLSASRALVAVAARSLASSDADITLPQYRALVVLASRGPQRIRDLAEHLAIDSSNATRACDRLQRRGFVRRHQDADDRRSVRVSVTPSGEELVRVITEARRGEITQIIASMPDWGRGQVVAGLRAFADAAGEVPEQDWSMGWSGAVPPVQTRPATGRKR